MHVLHRPVETAPHCYRWAEIRRIGSEPIGRTTAAPPVSVVRVFQAASLIPIFAHAMPRRELQGDWAGRLYICQFIKLRLEASRPWIGRSFPDLDEGFTFRNCINMELGDPATGICPFDR
jgi:hypothetical protein